MKIIDLHTHSNKSDGTLSPTALVSCARDAGLSAIALTDHDTASGLNEAQEAGEQLGLEVIPGVELAADYDGEEIHILGYFIDYKGQYFNENIIRLAGLRDNRNKRLLDRLESLGMRLTQEELFAEAEGRNILTRLHFARAMRTKGYVKSVQEAFARYLDPDRPAFIDRLAFSYGECIEIIGKSGGVAVLAHPFLYKWKDGEVVQVLERLRSAGLEGVETLYPLHSRRQTALLIKTAETLGLKITGGSDFHGANKPNIKIGTGMDNIRVEYEVLEKLRK